MAHPWTLNKADAVTIRKIVRAVAKKHGIKLSVRTGTGSMRGTVRIGTYPDPPTTAPRLDLLRQLERAGYEGAMSIYDVGSFSELRMLSTQWGHTQISLNVMKAPGRKQNGRRKRRNHSVYRAEMSMSEARSRIHPPRGFAKSSGPRGAENFKAMMGRMDELALDDRLPQTTREEAHKLSHQLRLEAAHARAAVRKNRSRGQKRRRNPSPQALGTVRSMGALGGAATPAAEAWTAGYAAFKRGESYGSAPRGKLSRYWRAGWYAGHYGR